MMTSTSIRAAAILALTVFLVSIASGSHYYSHNDQGYSVTQDSGFSVPEYSSQSELATELVAPFLFIVVLLKFAFERVLQFVLDTNDHPPWDDEPSVSRESTLMSIAVAGMMIPTPFWDYVRIIASSIGLIAASAVALVLLFLIYSFIK